MRTARWLGWPERSVVGISQLAHLDLFAAADVIYGNMLALWGLDGNVAVFKDCGCFALWAEKKKLVGLILQFLGGFTFAIPSGSPEVVLSHRQGARCGRAQATEGREVGCRRSVSDS
jgi:hypothetical protein